MNGSWNLLYGYDQHISEEIKWKRTENIEHSKSKHRHTHTNMYPGH